MLSKNQIKQIQSLQNKKQRNELNCFVAEGEKLVSDLLGFFECEWLIATPEWWQQHREASATIAIECSKDDLKKASALSSPPEVIAIFTKPNYALEIDSLKNKLTIVADCIQDPGNLGTIIRLADWFGVDQIICSMDCVDVYNPKTIQATMGALSRVKVHYVDLEGFFAQTNDIPIYGTFLDGDDLYQSELSESALVIMGNEGNGISENIEKWVTKRLYIPNFPAGKSTSESLNVAIATAVVCAEFRRRQR